MKEIFTMTCECGKGFKIMATEGIEFKLGADTEYKCSCGRPAFKISDLEMTKNGDEYDFKVKE